MRMSIFSFILFKIIFSFFSSFLWINNRCWILIKKINLNFVIISLIIILLHLINMIILNHIFNVLILISTLIINNLTFMIFLYYFIFILFLLLLLILIIIFRISYYSYIIIYLLAHSINNTNILFFIIYNQFL